MIDRRHLLLHATRAALLLLIVPGLATTVLSDDPVRPDQAVPRVELKLPGDHQVVGLTNCRLCHKARTPAVEGAANPMAALEAIDLLVPEGNNWVNMNEYTIWGGKDKHHQAYAALLSEKSKAMGRILRVTEIHRDKRCLACHASYPVEQLKSSAENPLLIPADDIRHPAVFLGVNCEGCHGPAGDRLDGSGKGWAWEHTAWDRWRFKSPREKAEFGFRNVRSKVTQAQLCLSCHLGNAAEGKLVTHEMYAAGHPPLPAFEIETFIAEMPPHWQSLHAKKAEIRDEYLKRTGQVFYQGEMARTKSVLIGALVSAGGNYGLIADLAGERGLNRTVLPDGTHLPWPELSQFDCFSCHHDLKDRSWRRTRARPGAPGRPAIREWPTVLVDLALDQTAGDATAYRAAVQDVHELLQKSPFGEPVGLADAARRASTAAIQLAWELEDRELAAEPARQLRMKLAETGAEQLVDYDAARQLLWAFRVVDGEIRQREADDPVTVELAQVASGLFLNIRGDSSRPQDSPETESISGVKLPVQYVDQARALPKISSYEPKDFQEGFRRILDALKRDEAAAQSTRNGQAPAVSTP